MRRLQTLLNIFRSIANTRSALLLELASGIAPWHPSGQQMQEEEYKVCFLLFLVDKSDASCPSIATLAECMTQAASNEALQLSSTPQLLMMRLKCECVLQSTEPPPVLLYCCNKFRFLVLRLPIFTSMNKVQNRKNKACLSM